MSTLVPAIVAAVDAALKKDNQAWGRRLASTLETQSVRLRLKYGFNPKNKPQFMVNKTE